MAPIRILQVVNSMNRGGAETTIMNLYRELDRSDIQFDFLVHDNKEAAYDNEIAELGGRRFISPAFRLFNYREYKSFLNKFFSEHPEYRIVHGHQYNTASIYLNVAKKNGAITIAHSHNTKGDSAFSGIVKSYFRYRLPSIPHHCFACSQEAGSWLYRGKRKFQVINNAIHAEDYSFSPSVRTRARQELSITQTRFVIGHVGNLRAQKNHAFLLRIFKELLNLHPESTLLLVGNGPLKEKITEQIHQLNLTENVLMLGDRPDVRLLLQAMDLIVMPSLHEGLPVTLIEAQAAGLHCLVADNISDEVSVTDQIHYCSIAKTPKIWAKKIMGFHPSRQRQVTTSLIKNAGFDVKTVAKSLTKFYLNCHSQ